MSLISLSVGEWEKSGPVGDIGANAIEKAIIMPPQAINGMAYDTPVSKCWRSFLSCSIMTAHSFHHCTCDTSQNRHHGFSNLLISLCCVHLSLFRMSLA